MGIGFGRSRVARGGIIGLGALAALGIIGLALGGGPSVPTPAPGPTRTVEPPWPRGQETASPTPGVPGPLPAGATDLRSLRSFHFNASHFVSSNQMDRWSLDGFYDVVHARASFTDTRGWIAQRYLLFNGTLYSALDPGWRPTAGEQAPTTPYIPEPAGGSRYQLTGLETVDGIPCRVYHFESRTDNKVDGVSSTFWIGVPDGIPRRIQQGTQSEVEDVSDGIRISQVNEDGALAPPFPPPPAPATLFAAAHTFYFNYVHRTQQAEQESTTTLTGLLDLAHGQAWLVQTAVDPPTGALSITRQIVLGPDLYTQAGANWTRSAGGPARLAAVLTSLHGLLPNGGAGYVPAGQEMVAGSLANIYSYPLPGATLVPSGASAPSWDVYGYPGPTTTPRPVTRVASYWVDSADGLLRRLSVAGRAGPQTTTDYLEIGAVNQPVTIARPGSAPTPVPTPAADCHPGWSVAPGADAGPLYAITSRGPADAWAVGASATRPQTALIQRWDGARWQTLPAPNAGPGDNRLAAVVATGPADAWAAGSYTNGPAGRRALLVHWDGTVWSRVPEPGDLPTDPQTVSDTDPQTVSELLGLAATGPDDVWAVGTIHPANYSGRESLILHWDGRQWRRVASPPAGALQAVAAAGPQSAWAAGESLLHWDGTRWEGIADLPAAADTARTFTSLVLEGPDDLWALGMRGGAATYLDEQDSERPSLDQTVAQMAHWDGQRWQLLPEVDPLGCRCLRIWGGAASGPDDLWAIGTGVLRWNGQGWQAIAPPRSSGLPPYISLGPWRAAAAAGPGSFWMVGTMHTDQAAQPGPFAFRYTAGPCPAGP